MKPMRKLLVIGCFAFIANRMASQSLRRALKVGRSLNFRSTFRYRSLPDRSGCNCGIRASGGDVGLLSRRIFASCFEFRRIDCVLQMSCQGEIQSVLEELTSQIGAGNDFGVVGRKLKMRRKRSK